MLLAFEECMGIPLLIKTDKNIDFKIQVELFHSANTAMC